MSLIKYDLAMNSQNLLNEGMIRLPIVEQAMAWLIEVGPLVDNPELPPWVLKHLVHQRRIVRLRNGLYLVPDTSMRLPTLQAVVSLLAPHGYIGFYAALTIHALTDQDFAEWIVVTDRHTASIRYGRRSVRFLASPSRMAIAQVTTRTSDGVDVRHATPAQALCETLQMPKFGPDLPELLHCLRAGLETGLISRDTLHEIVEKLGSPLLARRLGLLIELVTGEIDQELLRTSRRSHAMFAAWPGAQDAVDPVWRLVLPETRERIVYAARA